MKKISLLFLMLFLSITIVSCEKDVKLEKLTIEGPATVDVLTYKTVNYSVTPTPDKASKDVTWSVNQPEYATINESGVLTVLATRWVQIEISAVSKSNPEISATKQVTLSAPTVSITGDSQVQIGETIELTKVIVGTTDNAVTWTSSNPAVATVSSTGAVTGVSVGETEITVSLTNHPTYKATRTIAVVEELVTWFGNGNDAQFFEISVDSGLTTIAYNKVGSTYAYVFYTVPEYETVNRVAITLSSPVQGTNVLIKPADDSTLEVTVSLTTEAKTYYFAYGDKRNDRVLLFPAPGVGDASGSIIVHSVVTNTNKWADNGDNIYTVENNTIVWNKTDKPNSSWSYVSLPIAKWSTVKRVVLNITGSAGQKLLLKLRGNPNVESNITLTGEATNFTIAVSNIDLSADNLLLIFANPGQAAGSGQFTVNSVNVFTTLEAAPIPWVSNPDGADVATVVDNLNGSYTVNYSGNGWTSVSLPIPEGNNNRVIVTLSSVNGETNPVLVKYKNKVELKQSLNATGDTVYELVCLDTVSAGDNRVYIFPFAGQQASGSLVIKSVQFITYTNGLWSGNDVEGVYTVSEEAGVTSVVADKAAFALPTGDSAYSPLSYGVANNANYKGASVALKGAVGGEAVIIKVLGGVEKSVILTTDWVVYTVKAPNLGTIHIDDRIILFALPGAKEGTISFQIKDVVLLEEGSELVWTTSESSLFTIVPAADNGAVVTFNNPGAGWRIVQLPVDGQQNYTKVTITLQGTEGTRIKLKFHDQIEKDIVLDGTVQTFEITHTATNTDQYFRMFVVYGDVAQNTVFEGTFTIISTIFE